MTRTVAILLFSIVSVSVGLAQTSAPEIIPPGGQIRKDHPRLLIRPNDTPLAVSLAQLKAIPRDAEFNEMLAQIRKSDGAAANALAWLLTGEKADAEKALAALQAWKAPQKAGDPFAVYFGCRDIALAYDWLHEYPGFTEAIKAAVRDQAQPLADAGYKSGRDHVFHNYVWMWNSGAALWALAAAGDDPRADKLLDGLREQFNANLFPAMAYLAGQPADAPGYWSLYCLAPGVMTLLGTQSAFEQDLAGKVARDGGNWVALQLENLAHQTLPNLRNAPWGDQQSGGDGGIAHEMACNIDMMTWAAASPTGACLSKSLAAARGVKRFYGETAMFYFLYSRTMKVEPKAPPLAHLSGDKSGGNWYAREKWDDSATVVGFHSADSYTGHNHLDQGTFVIYRKGLLAVDAGQYKNVGGSQTKTVSHNTLLFAGAGQRRTRPNPLTLDAYLKSLKSPKGPESGNMPFCQDGGDWAAATGEFGQAYDDAVVGRAIRQVLFIRPGTVVVVDQLAAPQGKDLPEVSWLLHLPPSAKADGEAVTADNGQSWIRCRPIAPGGVAPATSPDLSTQLGLEARKAVPTLRAEYKYPGKPRMTLVHVLEVGDGRPGPAAAVTCQQGEKSVAVSVAGKSYVFSVEAPFVVTAK